MHLQLQVAYSLNSAYIVIRSQYANEAGGPRGFVNKHCCYSPSRIHIIYSVMPVA